jgi:hypothetical protein
VDAPGLLLAALLCAEVAAVGLAWRLVRGSLGSSNTSGVRPKAPGPAFPQEEVARGRYLLWLLTFALADELAQLGLHVALDGAPRPLAGWYRAGWHVSIALSLGWPAALARCAGATKFACPGSLPGTESRLNRASCAPWPARGRCERSTAGEDGGARRARQALLGAYLGTLAGLAIVYPPSTAGLRWTLLVWELCCVALAWWGLWRARRRTWGAAEAVLVVLVACESAVVLVGPFASDPFLRWWIARAFYLGAWGAVVAVLARAPRTA